MRLHPPLAVIAALLSLAGPASAVTLLVRMAPAELKGSGFTVDTHRLASGSTEFKITRDLSKTSMPGRTATLEVRGKTGMVVQCDVSGERMKGTITYTFQLGRQFQHDSLFTVDENLDDPAKPEVPKMIGGATIYEFHLAEFVSSRPEKVGTPAHG